MKLAWINFNGTAQAQLWDDDFAKVYGDKKKYTNVLEVHDVKQEDTQRSLDELKAAYPYSGAANV